MATGKALDGKPYAGNLHVRFDEGEVAPAATPRRGSLLYKKLNCMTFMLAIGIGAHAATVSTVEELTEAIWSSRGSGAVIHINPGYYDVSGVHMKHYKSSTETEADPVSHLAIDRVILQGNTTDPRSVVIYGDKSDRILYCWQGGVRNLTISNGCAKADCLYDGGGGLCGRNTGTKASNVVVTVCSAPKGGGIRVVQCTKVTVENCTSTGDGGGVYGSSDIPQFYNGVIRNCTAGGSGGGIYGKADVLNTQIYGNRSQVGGGGAHNVTATDCDFFGNYTEGSGGGCHTTTVRGGGVSNNVALVYGGGMNGGAAYDAHVCFNLLSNSTATASRGGGVYSASIVSNCIVSGNAIADSADRNGSGGAGRDTTFVDCRIYDNYATLGATAEGSSFFGCLISNNVASAKYKRHTLRNIQCLDGCDVCGELIDTPRRVFNTKYHGARSSWTLANGANVYTNGTFAADNGYLIQSSQGNGLCFTNCLFYDNIASAGLVYRPDGEVTTPVVNCTFAGNQVAYTFVGFNATHPCEVINSIFEGNTLYAGMTPRDLCYNTQGNNITLENCLVGTSSRSDVEALSHPNTIVSNAVRFDSENAENPYSIKRSSVARRNGKIMDWMDSATDIRRDLKYPRKRDGLVDIGCYQCWLDPVSGMALVFR